MGIVCSSWSVLRRWLNGGTRTWEQPAGNGTLHREIVGNEQARLMFPITHVFDEFGIPYTVEHPESSALWWLRQRDKIPLAVFDQCMLELAPPDLQLVKKHRVQENKIGRDSLWHRIGFKVQV